MKNWGNISKGLVLALFVSSMSFVGVYSPDAAVAESRLGAGHWKILAFQGVETVSWDLGTSVETVVLSRNGRELTRGSGLGEFKISGVSPNAQDQFVLSSSRDLDPTRIKELATQWNESELDVKSKVKHVSTGTLNITMPSLGGAGSSAEAANYLPTSTKFRYSTFIADAYMPDPPVACTDIFNPLPQRFVGDNRGPNPDSSKYRTRIDVDIAWTAFSEFSVTKATGPTRREQNEYVFSPYPHYEWKLNKQAYASKDSMSVARIGSPGWDYLSFSITQDVKDPLCNPATVSGVYFNFMVTISRTGGYQMDGETAVFPTHEVYFQDSTDHVWHTIMVLPTQNWFCLAPIVTAVTECKVNKSVFGVY